LHQTLRLQFNVVRLIEVSVWCVLYDAVQCGKKYEMFGGTLVLTAWGRITSFDCHSLSMEAVTSAETW
jgi:hypothetical protein